MEKKVYVYKMNGDAFKGNYEVSEDCDVTIWEAGIFKYIPPNSQFTYFFFWLMNMLGLFKNNDYRAYSFVVDGKTVCSLVCIPALYKWKFMSPESLQIKNVYTHPDHRGKGHAYNLVNYAIHHLNDGQRTFWYMTDEHNVASQRLCKKIGFNFAGRYHRSRNKCFLYEGDIVTSDEASRNRE